MTISEGVEIRDLLSESIERSMSYEEYIMLVRQMVENHSTTGKEKTEALASYTVLNNRRMGRWDKTLKISESVQEKIKSFKTKMTWLVLTESWCGDAAHIMPMINKVASINGNITFRVVLRDTHDQLMAQFLTNGAKSIPKVIMIDDANQNVIDTYGPRPKEATKLVNDFKAMHGKLTPEFKEELQLWYNKNKGQAVLEDLVEVLEKLGN